MQAVSLLQPKNQLQDPITGQFRKGNPGRPSPAFGKTCRENQLAARLNFGLDAAASVLPGIEKQEDWDNGLAAYIAIKQPVGKVEHDLLIAMYDVLWRITRFRRWNTGTTMAALFRAAELQPPEVRKQIELILGEPVILRSDDCIEVEQDEHNSFKPSAAWWRKLIDGPVENRISRNEVLQLLEFVATETSRYDADDNCCISPATPCGGQQIVQVPDDVEVTVGAVRAQLAVMDHTTDGLVSEIIALAREEAKKEAELVRLAKIEAKRFIADHLLPPDNTRSSAQWHERWLLGALARGSPKR